MLLLDAKYVFQTLDYVGYIMLMLVGCYFIHEGNVVKRFQQKKTTFAQNVEQMTEYPVVVTWIELKEARSPLELGPDFV